MQGVHGEPRPAPRRGAAGVQRAEHRHEGQEQQADLPARPAGEPQRPVHAATPWTEVTVPSSATSRAGSPHSASQPGAARPMTMAAVLAMFASTQVAATTLGRCASTAAATSPVRGSTMWCTVRPPRRQPPSEGAGGGEAARGEGEGQGGAFGVLVVVGDTPICQPSRWFFRRSRMSPPRLTSTRSLRDRPPCVAMRSAASAFAVAPRSSQRRAAHAAPAARPSQPHVATTRAPDRRRRERVGRRRGRLRRSRGRSPARERRAPTVGSTMPSVSSAARSATDDRPRRAAAPPGRWPRARRSAREISESGRNRLHAASIAANSSIRTAPGGRRDPSGSVVKSATEVPHTARSIRPVAPLVTTRPRWSGRVGSPDEAAGPAAAGPSAPTMAPGARECAERSAGADRPRAVRWTGASPRGGRDPRRQAPDPTERTRPRKGPTPPSPRLPRARSSTGSAAGCRPPARGVGRREEGESRRRVSTAMFGDSSEPAPDSAGPQHRAPRWRR